MRGLFVTGTDTGAGKTVVAAAIAAALHARGERVAAWKPVVTGVDEPADGAGWPADHELLARAVAGDPQDATTATFGPAVSPHLAAELAERMLSLDVLVRAARGAAADADVLIAEAVGGLLVPFGDFDVRDLAVAAGLRVRAVVLTPWPDEPSVVERSNRETIERLGTVAVATLPPTTPAAEDLARAGATLPVDAWIGGS